MAAFGRNMKITIDRAQRAQVRAVFEGVLGCAVAPDGPPNADIYVFPGGEHFGAFGVDAAEALDAARVRQGAWAEFLVADVEKAKAGLAAAGVRPFEYADKAHSYYQIPGLVFRLASEKA